MSHDPIHYYVMREKILCLKSYEGYNIDIQCSEQEWSSGRTAKPPQIWFIFSR